VHKKIKIESVSKTARMGVAVDLFSVSVFTLLFCDESVCIEGSFFTKILDTTRRWGLFSWTCILDDALSDVDSGTLSGYFFWIYISLIAF
jgi:hypothetical protein